MRTLSIIFALITVTLIMAPLLGQFFKNREVREMGMWSVVIQSLRVAVKCAGDTLTSLLFSNYCGSFRIRA